MGCGLIAFSCKDKGKEDFDRSEMLENYSSIITSRYSDYSIALSDLKTKTDGFTADATESNLSALELSYNTAYLNYQRIKMFDFGPMEEYTLTSKSNIYPTDTALILANISSTSTDFNAQANYGAIGFPAIDYLINARNDAQILIDFTSAERKNYLTGCVDKLISDFLLVNTKWNNEYIAQFKAANGNDVGSSTSLMYNAFIKDVELLKNAKIGIPSGQQTGGMTLPSYVEGFYGNTSISLAKESCTTLKEIFNGEAGVGFDEYVRNVEGEVETSIVDVVNNQFDLCLTKLDAISNLSVEVESEFNRVNDAYKEIKTLITYLKTDVASLLGILITFQDNDGD